MLRGLLKRILGGKLKSREGYVMILVAFLIPVVFMGVKYIVKKIELEQNNVIQTNSINRIADTAARLYDPAIPFSSQKDGIYAAAASTLNEAMYKLYKKMIMQKEGSEKEYRNVIEISESDINRVVHSLSHRHVTDGGGLGYDFTNLNRTLDVPIIDGRRLIDSVEVLGQDKYKVTFFSTTQKEGGVLTNRNYDKYKEDGEILSVFLDTSRKALIFNNIKEKREVLAYIPRCNANIILAIPTNSETCYEKFEPYDYKIEGEGMTITPGTETLYPTAQAPISIIARACGKFLEENFSNTYGVAIGVVPYSGKISLDPYFASTYAQGVPVYEIPEIKAEKRSLDEHTNNTRDQSKVYAYWKQAASYGTVGKDGAKLDENKNRGVQYDGLAGIGIMYRQGSPVLWNTISLYSGSNGRTGTECLLLDNSTTNENNMHYQIMPTNPCYAAHCNVTGNVCEKNCPEYMMNPYYICELTDNVMRIVNYLRLFTPFEDRYNKSNFLFLPLHWAGNLLSDWTEYPKQYVSDKIGHPERSEKKNFVVLVVNKPSHFEPHEMTYLGFDNDNAEIPVSETEAIAFKSGTVENTGGKWSSTKGMIHFQATDNSAECIDAGNGLQCTGKFRITLSKKNLLFIKVREPDDTGKLTIYDNENLEQTIDNVGEHAIPGNKSFTFSGSDNFFPDGQPLLSDTKCLQDFTTTGGKNFGHNLSTKKLYYKAEGAKITGATLQNQVLRCAGSYKKSPADAYMKDLILNNDGHVDEYIASGYQPYIDSCLCIKTGLPDQDISQSVTMSINADFSGSAGCKGMPRGYLVISVDTTERDAYDDNEGFIRGAYRSDIDYVYLSRNTSVVTGSVVKSNNGAYQVYPFEGDVLHFLRLRWKEPHASAEFQIREQCYDTSNNWSNYERYYDGYIDDINLALAKFGDIGPRPSNSIPYIGDRWHTIATAKSWVNGKAVVTIPKKDLTMFDGLSYLNGLERTPIYYHPDIDFKFWGCMVDKIVLHNEESVCEIFRPWIRDDNYSICIYRENKGGYFYPKDIDDIEDVKMWISVKDFYNPETSAAIILTERNRRNHAIAYDCIIKFDKESFNKDELTYVKANRTESERAVNNLGGVHNIPRADATFYLSCTDEALNAPLHLNNFFFLNTENKTLQGYADSTSNADLLANKGIYLVKNIDKCTDDCEEGWVCFCGDGKLTLDVANTRIAPEGRKTVTLTNIADVSDGLYKANTEYDASGGRQIVVLPEQISQGTDGNYYIDVEMKNGVLVESIEMSNQPYYVKEVKVDYMGITEETSTESERKSLAAGTPSTETRIDGKKMAVFRVSDKRAFNIKALVPNAWFDTDYLDYREKSGTVTLCSNVPDTPVTVRANTKDISTPPAPTLSQTDTFSVWFDSKITIYSAQTLKNIKIIGTEYYKWRLYYSYQLGDQMVYAPSTYAFVKDAGYVSDPYLDGGRAAPYYEEFDESGNKIKEEKPNGAQLIGSGTHFFMMAKKTPYECNLDISPDDWKGAYGAYTYDITVPEHIGDLTVTGEPLQGQGTIDGKQVTSTTGEEVVLDCPTEISGDLYTKSVALDNCQVAQPVQGDGKVGEKVIIQGRDANVTEIEISPTSYDYVDTGNGDYMVTVPCENVVIKEVKLVDETPIFEAYGYDKGEGVQLFDFRERFNTTTGQIVDDISRSWDYNEGKSSWYLSENKATMTNSFTSSGMTSTNDFFIEFYDCDNVAPGVSFNIGGAEPEKITDSEFGEYTMRFSYSGAPLIFLPHGIYGSGTVTFSGKGLPMSGVFAGFTLPYNFALANNGYQQCVNGVVAPYPDEALQQLTKDACKKLKQMANTFVYVVKYGDEAKDVDELDGADKTYTAKTPGELTKVLRQIALEIKAQAGVVEGYTEVNVLK